MCFLSTCICKHVVFSYLMVILEKYIHFKKFVRIFFAKHLEGIQKQICIKSIGLKVIDLTAQTFLGKLIFSNISIWKLLFLCIYFLTIPSGISFMDKLSSTKKTGKLVIFDLILDISKNIFSVVYAKHMQKLTICKF